LLSKKSWRYSWKKYSLKDNTSNSFRKTWRFFY